MTSTASIAISSCMLGRGNRWCSTLVYFLLESNKTICSNIFGVTSITTIANSANMPRKERDCFVWHSIR
ncbi:unnamed protein product [Larinioides sclopetarius]|uniref:Uncharacterized protein n=1 Tax=Larinioides sclopetarius TaxID=280406 RepID=A0AAV2BGG4_9ARAC